MTELRAIKTYYDSRQGLVTLSDDVLGIVCQVRELYGGRVSVNWEPTTESFIFTENCEDGTERLIFACDELDPRALERLQRSDSHSRMYEDVYDKAEREQDELQAARDAKILDEQIMPAAEELAWSLGDGKFGPGYKQSIAIPRDLDG
jgi:hypothetical protein